MPDIVRTVTMVRLVAPLSPPWLMTAAHGAEHTPYYAQPGSNPLPRLLARLEGVAQCRKPTEVRQSPCRDSANPDLLAVASVEFPFIDMTIGVADGELQSLYPRYRITVLCLAPFCELRRHLSSRKAS